jgi:hypothetical protein
MNELLTLLVEFDCNMLALEKAVAELKAQNLSLKLSRDFMLQMQNIRESNIVFIGTKHGPAFPS